MLKIEEPFCPDGRPAIVLTVVAGLATLGFVTLGFEWYLFALAGVEDVGGPFGAFVAMVILAVVFCTAIVFFRLAWGYYKGRRRAWLGTILMTLPLLCFLRVQWNGNPPLAIVGSWAVAGLAIVIQVLAWLPRSRRLVWGRQVRFED